MRSDQQHNQSPEAEDEAEATMANPFKRNFELPAEQRAIRAKCSHPSGTFIEFAAEDVDSSIPERFEKIVRKYPDRLAVKTKEHELTYEELNSRANQLAHYISAAHGTSTEPVALFLDRWGELVIAHLAVLKSGKFSLALDPAADANRKSHLLADSGAKIVIVGKDTEKSARELLGGACSLINIDDLGPSRLNSNLKVQIGPEAYAYVRYTSGSTGSAKGAAKTHRHVLKAVMEFANHFRVCPEDRVTLLGVASIGKHLFIALLTGASFCPFDARKEGLIHLTEWLLRERITIYYSFPTAFRHFVSALSEPVSFPDLRLIEFEGEPVYERDVELFRKHFSSDCLLVNTLSSAETGTVCLYFLDQNSGTPDGRVPVGYPVEGMEILVLDDAGEPLGFDQVGEVAVRSRFLSDGYWRKPEVNSQKFIPQGEDGSSLYRTGDMGRVSQDGCLYLLGRKDFQVKVRSFRVDVTEVEATLANHPDVKNVTVIGKNDQSGNTRLVAYVVPKSHPGPATASLRSFLEQKLPEYMVPSSFVFLDELPLMSTGKVNRRGLPDPGRRRPELSTPLISPRTPIENEIAKIWADVLALDEVGVNDNFLDLGGHSLAASRIVSEMVRSFQLELPLKALFDSPTVAEMASLVMQNQTKKVAREDLERMIGDLEAMSEAEAEEAQSHSPRS
jgi:amino acid adenylation domain-containing protein